MLREYHLTGPMTGARLFAVANLVGSHSTPKIATKACPTLCCSQRPKLALIVAFCQKGRLLFIHRSADRGCNAPRSRADVPNRRISLPDSQGPFAPLWPWELRLFRSLELEVVFRAALPITRRPYSF